MADIKKVRQIRWRDSNIYLTQQNEDSNFDVAIIKSVGYVVEEDKNKIVLAGDVFDGAVRRVIVIPKENII